MRRVTDLYTDLPRYPLTFGNSAPVVSAAACLTGYYEITDIGDISICENFLRKGAAAYMGATISVADESDEFHNWHMVQSGLQKALLEKPLSY
jgi:hypothetical protein